MADKNVPISALPPLPEYCRFVVGSGNKYFICTHGEKSTRCEVIGDNKFVCGPENQQCKVINGHLGCERATKLIPVAPKGEEMPDVFMGHVYLVVNAAILSLALTQIIKPFIFKTCKEKADAVIRLFAVLTGAGIAYTLSNPFMMIDVYMGASAGALNAFVIKMFKAKVKKSLGVDEETPTPDEANK